MISEELGRKLDSRCRSRTSAAPAASSSPRTRRPSSRATATAKDIDGRIGQIKAALETTTSDWDREKLQERLGKLAGSVAVIKVGAATEVELKEKKHRVEDALSAPRAPPSKRASSPAVVWRSSTPCPRSTSSTLEGDERTGVDDPAPRARRAAAPHRDQRRPGRLGHRPGSEDADRSARATTPPRDEFGDMLAARHHRPAQGDALRPGERGPHRRHGADDELPGHGHPGGQVERPPRRRCTKPEYGTDEDCPPPLDAVGASTFPHPYGPLQQSGP